MSYALGEKFHISMEKPQITVHLPRAVDLICEIRASIFNRTPSRWTTAERSFVRERAPLDESTTKGGKGSLARVERIRFIGDGVASPVAGGGQMPLSLPGCNKGSHDSRKLDEACDQIRKEKMINLNIGFLVQP